MEDNDDDAVYKRLTEKGPDDFSKPITLNSDSGFSFKLSDKTISVCVRCRGICNIKSHKMIELEDVEEFIRLLKEDWRVKARRMEIMSGEVVIYELECLLDKRVGDLK